MTLASTKMHMEVSRTWRMRRYRTSIGAMVHAASLGAQTGKKCAILHHEPAMTLKHVSHIARTKITLGGKEKKRKKKSAIRFILYLCNEPEYNASHTFLTRKLWKKFALYSCKYSNSHKWQLQKCDNAKCNDEPHKTTVKADHSK